MAGAEIITEHLIEKLSFALHAISITGEEHAIIAMDGVELGSLIAILEEYQKMGGETK